MRTAVSAIGTPPYWISKYLVKIIQPTLNKSQLKIKNEVIEAKTWRIFLTEIQVSYDIVNLYLSIQIDKAIDVIVEYLENEFKNFKTRTKLALIDIHQPIELCVSECYFLYIKLICTLYNLGPTGLSTDCYLQRLEEKSIALSFVLNISHKTFKRYRDDSHTRFENKQKPFQFVEIVNKKDSSTQYTIRSSLTF